ncbi:MAG: hypothetical protein ABIJ12_09950 [bacterium]
MFRWNGNSWLEEKRLLPSNLYSDSRFGNAVSISVDTILVGAEGDDEQGVDAGAAYVFRWNGYSWIQQKKLFALDGKPYEKLGTSVDISGDVALLRALLTDADDSESGSAYVFRRICNFWVEDQQKLLPLNGNPNDSFGTSVAISNHHAVVGAIKAGDGNSVDSGSVYFFEHSTPNNDIKEIFFVDAEATGANNGTSWPNAFLSLQKALDVADGGDEIWVAEGTYLPSRRCGGNTDRYKAFQMKNDVAIYGGFDPTDGLISFADRNWENNPTVLSGDIGLKDDSSDNVFHVFFHPMGTKLNNSAILDGFTIIGGNANASYPLYIERDGGGMYNSYSSPIITNIIFSHNSANHDGGGVYNSYSSPIISYNIYSENQAFYGGGMYNSYSSPTITNSIFTENSAGPGLGGGGGMANESSSPIVKDSIFSLNSADFGGGMDNHYLSSPVVKDCLFVDNSARYLSGGGINNVTSSPTIIKTTFLRNTADDNGGGINNGSPLVVRDSIFLGNSAGYNGGGLSNIYSSIVTNSIFLGNSANAGGGMYNKGPSMAVSNTTLAANHAATIGGGILNSDTSSVVNSILWGNIPDSVNVDSGSMAVTYSDVQGGYVGAGNISEDPLFVNNSDPDPTNWDVHLQITSPCIDSGDNNSPDLPKNDIDGDSRRIDIPWILDTGNGLNPITDMGADEVSIDSIDTDGDGLSDKVEDPNQNGVVDSGETDPNDYNDPCSFINYTVVNSLYTSFPSDDTNNVVIFDTSQSDCYEMINCVKEDRTCSKVLDFGGSGSVIGGNGNDIIVYQYDNTGDYITSLTMTEVGSGKKNIKNLSISAEIVEIPPPSIDFDTALDNAKASLYISVSKLSTIDIKDIIVFWGDRNTSEYAGSLPITISHTYTHTGTDYMIRVMIASTEGDKYNFTFMHDEDLLISIP